MKLEYLSSNLINILLEILQHQDICKYIHYNQSNPLQQSDLSLPAVFLLKNDDETKKRVFPYPFNPSITIEDQTQLRIYYPSLEFKNGQVVEDGMVLFDIICSKNLWLIDGGLIRPYEIMKLIVNNFHDKSIDTVGKLQFKRFNHIFVNDKFDCLRLTGQIVTFGS